MLHRRSKGAAAIVRWTLSAGGALTVLLGLAVWPGKVVELAGLHGLAGFVVIVSMWATA